MSLKDRINEDMKAAMKARQELRLNNALCTQCRQQQVAPDAQQHQQSQQGHQDVEHDLSDTGVKQNDQQCLGDAAGGLGSMFADYPILLLSHHGLEAI